MTEPLTPLAAPGTDRLLLVGESVAFANANVPGLAEMMRSGSASSTDYVRSISFADDVASAAILYFGPAPWLLLFGAAIARVGSGDNTLTSTERTIKVHELKQQDLIGLQVGHIDATSALAPIVADTWTFCGGFAMHGEAVPPERPSAEAPKTERLQLGDPLWDPFADPAINLNELGGAEQELLDTAPCTLSPEGGEPIAVQIGAVIGRRPEEAALPDHVLIPLVSPKTSRVHAIVRVNADQVAIEDCNSGNGTQIRRGKVVLAVPVDQPIPLWDSDVVEIGGHKIHVHLG